MVMVSFFTDYGFQLYEKQQTSFSQEDTGITFVRDEY